MFGMFIYTYVPGRLVKNWTNTAKQQFSQTLFFSSEGLFVLTFSIILHEQDSFLHVFIHLFIYFGMCMTAWRMAALHMNASILI